MVFFYLIHSLSGMCISHALNMPLVIAVYVNPCVNLSCLLVYTSTKEEKKITMYKNHVNSRNHTSLCSFFNLYTIIFCRCNGKNILSNSYLLIRVDFLCPTFFSLILKTSVRINLLLRNITALRLSFYEHIYSTRFSLTTLCTVDINCYNTIATRSRMQKHKT